RALARGPSAEQLEQSFRARSGIAQRAVGEVDVHGTAQSLPALRRTLAGVPVGVDGAVQLPLALLEHTRVEREAGCQTQSLKWIGHRGGTQRSSASELS